MSAITYSTVETAIVNNLKVFEYLTYLFDTLLTINRKDEES